MIETRKELINKIDALILGLLMLSLGLFVGLFLERWANESCPGCVCSPLSPIAKPTPVSCPEANLTCNCEPAIIRTCAPVVVHEKPSLFQQIANNLVEEKEYRIDEYDCTEYSDELARRLEDEGWKARRVQVVVDCDSGLFNKTTCKSHNGKHDITEIISPVFIDSTIGEVISPRYYKIYGMR